MRGDEDGEGEAEEEDLHHEDDGDAADGEDPMKIEYADDYADGDEEDDGAEDDL